MLNKTITSELKDLKSIDGFLNHLIKDEKLNPNTLVKGKLGGRYFKKPNKNATCFRLNDFINHSLQFLKNPKESPELVNKVIQAILLIDKEGECLFKKKSHNLIQKLFTHFRRKWGNKNIDRSKILKSLLKTIYKPEFAEIPITPSAPSSDLRKPPSIFVSKIPTSEEDEQVMECLLNRNLFESVKKIDITLLLVKVMPDEFSSESDLFNTLMEILEEKENFKQGFMIRYGTEKGLKLNNFSPYLVRDLLMDSRYSRFRYLLKTEEEFFSLPLTSVDIYTEDQYLVLNLLLDRVGGRRPAKIKQLSLAEFISLSAKEIENRCRSNFESIRKGLPLIRTNQLQDLDFENLPQTYIKEIVNLILPYTEQSLPYIKKKLFALKPEQIPHIQAYLYPFHWQILTSKQVRAVEMESMIKNKEKFDQFFPKSLGSHIKNLSVEQIYHLLQWFEPIHYMSLTPAQIEAFEFTEIQKHIETRASKHTFFMMFQVNHSDPQTKDEMIEKYKKIQERFFPLFHALEWLDRDMLKIRTK